jgi:hypothetical protein
VARAFGEAVGLSGAHYEQAVVCGERSVVSEYGVKGEVGGCGQFEDLCAGGVQFAAESVVLGLRGGKVRSMAKPKRMPVFCTVGLVPASRAGRTDEDAFERAHHGVAVEEGGE